MKVFVSGQIEEKAKIKGVYSRLLEEGFTITHDWTRTDDLTITKKVSTEAGLRAEKDIAGVCDADVYIIMTDNSRCGKGMYVELGAALALVQIGRSMRIYVIGPKNHPSIFYSHPAVVHFEDLENCIRHIKTSGLPGPKWKLQVS